MDLRPYIKTEAQLEQGIQLIRDKLVCYQPFVLADDIEVGEGMNFCDKYKGVETVFDLNVYAKSKDIGARKQPLDVGYFRRCNQEYRLIYEYVAEQICENIGEQISKLTFAEIGCNTGLNLFNLASRGAKKCYGFDWNDMTPVFRWLNDVLGTDAEFHEGTYCNLTHTFRGADVPEVDVMINTVFMNHQCDPLQFLSFICDRARKGVFLWVLIEDSQNKDECVLRYPSAPPHEILDTNRPFPLYFNNDVRLSEALLRLALNRLGFEDFRPIPKYVPGPKWQDFQNGFRMYFARRTSPIKSAYWGLDVPIRQRRLTAKIFSRIVRKLFG